MEKINNYVTVDSDSMRVDNRSKRQTIKLVLAKSVDEFQEARCTECGRLLFKVKDLQKSQIEIKCGKCGTFNMYN